MALITFKNLPDTTTPLNAENLNNNFEYLDNKTDIYSTNETLTNKIWIDGKPIYRKLLIIPKSAFPSSRGMNQPHNIDNLETVTLYHGIIERNEAFNTMPWIAGIDTDSESNWNAIVNDITTTFIHVRVGESTYNSLKNIYITLEYTKTTD